MGLMRDSLEGHCGGHEERGHPRGRCRPSVAEGRGRGGGGAQGIWCPQRFVPPALSMTPLPMPSPDPPPSQSGLSSPQRLQPMHPQILPLSPVLSPPPQCQPPPLPHAAPTVCGRECGQTPPDNPIPKPVCTPGSTNPAHLLSLDGKPPPSHPRFPSLSRQHSPPLPQPFPAPPPPPPPCVRSMTGAGVCVGGAPRDSSSPCKQRDGCPNVTHQKSFPRCLG